MIQQMIAALMPSICASLLYLCPTRGEQDAEAVLRDLEDAGIVEREDMDRDFWRQAGKLKADYRRISLADCFCAALANRLDAGS